MMSSDTNFGENAHFIYKKFGIKFVIKNLKIR